MSKLSAIKEAISRNPAVVIIKEEETNYFADELRVSYIKFEPTQVIVLSVAPSTGFTTLDEFKGFQNSLIPLEDVEDVKQNHLEVCGSEIKAGEISIEKVIAKIKIRKEIIPVDGLGEAIKKKLNSGDGQTVFEGEYNLLGKIIIRIYPDPEVARRCLEENKTWRFPKKWLEEVLRKRTEMSMKSLQNKK